MYCVDKDGVLSDSTRGIVKKMQFHNKFDFNYSMLSNVTKNFSLLHQTINSLIESIYRVNIERVSRTEKNKGDKDYSSSSYTITAGLDKIDNPINLDRIKEKLYTLKGASIGLLESMLPDEHSIFVKGYYSFTDDCLDKDIALYQKIPNSQNIIVYNPIKIVGLRDTKYYKEFELDSMDQAVYLGYVTKFMEMFGNYMLQSELNYYIQYEIWLHHIFKKYFKSLTINLEDLEDN